MNQDSVIENGKITKAANPFCQQVNDSGDLSCTCNRFIKVSIANPNPATKPHKTPCDVEPEII